VLILKGLTFAPTPCNPLVCLQGDQCWIEVAELLYSFRQVRTERALHSFGVAFIPALEIVEGGLLDGRGIGSALSLRRCHRTKQLQKNQNEYAAPLYAFVVFSSCYCLLRDCGPCQAVHAGSQVDGRLHFPGAQVEHRDFPGAGPADVSDLSARTTQDFRRSLRNVKRTNYL
jgi:hypothetical protein